MVHRGNPLQADFFSPRENWQHPQGGRPALSTRPGPVHERCLTVGDSLRSCAGIPVKEFAVIALLENGEEKVYSSTSLKPYQDRIFTDRVWQEFRRSVRRADTERTYPISGHGHDGIFTVNEFDIESTHETRKHWSSGGSSSERSRRRNQRQSRSEDSDDGSMSSKRKRARPSRYRYADSDDTPVPVPATKTLQLMIGDEDSVEKFYLGRFKDMQQSACKVMGKAFVKLVEPKKQTHHPYTKGDEQAPQWWPPTSGDNNVRHKEPDHLLKPERIRLLAHILRMLVEPIKNQHPAIQKLGLNIKKLEEVTMEAMSNWFNDKDHPENISKKPCLKEIFKIARAEERYKAGEIDGTTYFSVMYGEGSVVDGSDDEGDDGVKDEDEEQHLPANISTGMSSSDGMVSPSMMQTHSDAESSSMFQSNNRVRPIPLRYASQPHIEEQQASYNDPACFSRGMGIGFQSPGPHDPNRRGFASPVYQSPPTVYGWSSQNGSISTNGPVASGYYTTSPQSTVGTSMGQYQLPPPNSQQAMLPPPMSHHYDSLPNGRPYDVGSGLGNQLRTGSLSHPHHLPQNGFQEYLHDSVGFGNTDAEVKDSQKHAHHDDR